MLIRTGGNTSGGITLNGKYHDVCANGDVISGDVSSSFTVSMTNTQSGTSWNTLFVDTSAYSSITVVSNISLFNPKIIGIGDDGIPVDISTAGGSGTTQTANVSNYNAIMWVARVEGLTQLSVTMS